VTGVLIFGLCLWETFGFGGKFRVIEVPGFHELKLDTPGLYAGIYQHRGTGPIPVKELSAVNVHLMKKESYEEVPVLMNNAGQTFNQFGFQGMPLFNFVIQDPGDYTLSAAYLDERGGPTVSILLIAQAVQNVKQTLIVGIAFFALFIALGIFMLVKLNSWAPRPGSAAPGPKPLSGKR
jgi:hypothetical protein